MAPEPPRCMPLKSASVIEALMVTGGGSFHLSSPLMVKVANALMAKNISGVVLSGLFWKFVYLLALGDSSSESFNAGHVVAIVCEVIVADIETRHRPVGGDLGR